MSDAVPGTRCTNIRTHRRTPTVPTDPFGVSVPDPLALPRVAPRLVPRPRLLRRLSRMAPVTVVDALPGFGKTTLVADWTRQRAARGEPVVWIRAGSELDSPAAFLDVLERGLVRAGVTDDSDRLGRDEPGPRWLAVLRSRSRPVIVVVDDADRLRDTVLVDGLMRIVARAPSLHLVVCADGASAFAEAAERHGLETNVLRGADLRVPTSLVPRYARAWGHEVSEAEATALDQLVGGWPLPLRLLLDETPPGATRIATGAALHFLVCRVAPGVADRDDIGRASLERHGLTQGADGDEVRAPDLVRAVLLSPGGSDQTHDLVLHARATKDWPLLTRLWVDEGWELASTDAHVFQQAYAGLPPAVTRDGLCVAATAADALATTSPDTPWVRRVETVFRQYAAGGADFLRAEAEEHSPERRVELLVAAMFAQRTAGNHAQARHLAAEAAAEMSRARQRQPELARSSQAGWLNLQSAITHLMCGDIAAAVELAAAANQARPHTVVGAGAAGLLAVIHAISGESSKVDEWLAAHDEVDLTEAWVADLALMPARMARAMRAMDALDTAASEAELASVPLGTDASGLWPLALLVHARHALLSGDVTAMLARLHHIGRVSERQLRERDAVPREIYDRCLADLSLAVGDGTRAAAVVGNGHDVDRWLCAPAARLHLLAGSPADAAQVASAAIWRHDLRTRDRIELLVVHALASRSTGQEGDALDSFRNAHALALDSGNLEPFLLMPRDVRDELLEATGLELGVPALERLAAARLAYPERVDLVRLSPRELEVLRQLPHHDTAAALARHLTVSVNTVKKQLGSLYAKLGTNNRAAALLRAQQLGLVEVPRPGAPDLRPPGS